MPENIPFRDLLEDSLKDPETKAEWDRTQLSRDVSIWLLSYRTKHKLSQAALARALGWKQPVIARLESGEHEPSIATLQHLVERLDTKATIEIEPGHVAVHFARAGGRRAAGREGTRRTRVRPSAAATSPVAAEPVAAGRV